MIRFGQPKDTLTLSLMEWKKIVKNIFSAGLWAGHVDSVWLEFPLPFKDLLLDIIKANLDIYYRNAPALKCLKLTPEPKHLITAHTHPLCCMSSSPFAPFSFLFQTCKNTQFFSDNKHEIWDQNTIYQNIFPHLPAAGRMWQKC